MTPNRAKSLVGVRLDSESLTSKWGFDDGDVLDDFLGAEELDLPKSPDPDFSFKHLLLIHLVERYLVPQVPNCPPTHHILTHHNPIRLVNQDQEIEDVTVFLGPEVIYAMIDEIKGRYQL